MQFVLAMMWLGGCTPGTTPSTPEIDTEAGQTRLTAFDSLRQSRVARLPFELDVANRRLPVCLPMPQVTPQSLDVDRSLFVHDLATLTGADFSLKKTLDELASRATSTVATTGEELFTAMWDDQHAPTHAGKCPDGTGQVNGFPYDCRAEGDQSTTPAQEIDKYRAIGLVNRMDLAPEGWANCGEYRIVYGRSDSKRNFIIFEAVLPNPRPGCSEGCRPVAEFWASLTQQDDPKARAAALHQFFYDGLPLPNGGAFPPVVHFDHYTAQGRTSSYGASGSGQIRTNQFFQSPWQLKEYKTAMACTGGTCIADVVPIPVQVNPSSILFSTPAGNTHPLATAFQGEFLAQRPALASAADTTFSYQVGARFNAAQSSVDRSNDYATAADAAFTTQIAGALPPGMTAEQVLKRAITQSCAGCHDPGSFGLSTANALGQGVSWPASLRFVHTSERAVPQASPTEFPLSPALRTDFLPRRQARLAQILSAPRCACPIRPSAFRAPIATRLRTDLDDIVRARAERFEALRAELADLPDDPRQRETAVAGARALIGEVDQAILQAMAEADAPLDPALSDFSVRRFELQGDNTRQQRIEAVVDQMAEEPPRKSWTGSFTIH